MSTNFIEDIPPDSLKVVVTLKEDAVKKSVG
jgi:hypothetical protein